MCSPLPQIGCLTLLLNYFRQRSFCRLHSKSELLVALCVTIKGWFVEEASKEICEAISKGSKAAWQLLLPVVCSIILLRWPQMSSHNKKPPSAVLCCWRQELNFFLTKSERVFEWPAYAIWSISVEYRPSIYRSCLHWMDRRPSLFNRVQWSTSWQPCMHWAEWVR